MASEYLLYYKPDGNSKAFYLTAFGLITKFSWIAYLLEMRFTKIWTIRMNRVRLQKPSGIMIELFAHVMKKSYLVCV